MFIIQKGKQLLLRFEKKPGVGGVGTVKVGGVKIRNGSEKKKASGGGSQAGEGGQSRERSP